MRARFALVVLGLVLAGHLAITQAETTSGFQNTVNNYNVGMNPQNECRHPSNGRPACSQWFHFKFQANTDGTVNAPFSITNDSLNGYCGRVRIIARDRANPPGNILLNVLSPRYCIQGKGFDTDFHERVADVNWTFKTDPSVGLNGHDLYMVGEDYEDIGIDLGIWIGLARNAIEVVGFALKMAPMVGL